MTARVPGRASRSPHVKRERTPRVCAGVGEERYKFSQLLSNMGGASLGKGTGQGPRKYTKLGRMGTLNQGRPATGCVG